MQPVVCSMALKGTTVVVATMASPDKVCWGLPRVSEILTDLQNTVGSIQWITATKNPVDV